MHYNFRPCFTNIHEVALVSLPRTTSGTSGTNGNVAVFQNRIMVMNKKEAPRVIRPRRIQI